MLRLSSSTFVFALLCARAPSAEAQPADSTGRHREPLPRAWLSLGVGAGDSFVGGFAVRAAGTFSVNRMVTFALSETAIGNLGADRSFASTSLLIGVQTPDPRQFVFLSAGGASAICGNDCSGQTTGVALEGGIHGGGRHAGLGLTGFLIQAPGHNRSGGVVMSVDLGWFTQ